jgi:neutral ceramidase
MSNEKPSVPRVRTDYGSSPKTLFQAPLPLFFMAAFLSAILFNSINASAAEGLRERAVSVGVAQVNITPAIPVTMSGYASRTEPFKGINDELFAAATVFDDGVNKAVIITADVIGFSHDSWKELTERIERETGIPEKFVILAPAHNHGGPNTRAYGDDAGENLLSYNRELRDKLVAITKEAAANVQPAFIGSGSGICKMSMNRRALNANGGIRLGRNPDGPCDQEVGVVRIDKPDRTPFTIFVTWPTHATVMGPGNEMITGDWPGAARRHIEEAYTVPVIATVTAGASGDIDPIYRVRPTFRPNEVEEIGMILAEEVVRVAGEIRTYQAGTVDATQRLIMLPGKVPGGSNLPREFWDPGPDLAVRLSVLRVGNILFAGISGELFTEIGMKIKEISPSRHTHVITHCNGASGYLVTDQAFSEGGYEVTATRAMPGAEKIIIDNLAEMMNEIF